MAHRFPLVLAAAAAVVLALTACAPDDTDPAASGTSSATSPASSTPSTTPTPTPAEASIPKDCAAVGTAATRAATVDQLNLQGDGTGFERPAPDGATLVLGCDWFAGDTTGFLLLVSDVDPAAAGSYITTLPAEGFACTAPDADGATMCTMTTPNSEYPVDTVETVIWRDGVWIYSSATNLDGTALLNDLQNSIWVD
jgi:hypothetical protein